MMVSLFMMSHTVGFIARFGSCWENVAFFLKQKMQFLETKTFAAVVVA